MLENLRKATNYQPIAPFGPLAACVEIARHRQYIQRARAVHLRLVLLTDVEKFMAKKVVIDCDPGIDDAVALCLALFDPRLEVLAVTAVEGNATATQSSRNVQALIEQLDPPRYPRMGVADSPDGAPLHELDQFYGQEGHRRLPDSGRCWSSCLPVGCPVALQPEAQTGVVLDPFCNVEFAAVGPVAIGGSGKGNELWSNGSHLRK